MSLAKAVPGGLKDHECKKMAFRKCPPIPFTPEKDSVQETVLAFKDNHLKMQINKGMDLQVHIWHSGSRKAFLIHVGSAQESIKKKEYCKSYEESVESYAEQHAKIKQLKSQLPELNRTSSQTGTTRKSSKNPNKTTAEVSLTSSALHADIMAELKQAVEATDKVIAKSEKLAEDMFQLYANLLSVNARYAWNKIVQDQANADPYLLFGQGHYSVPYSSTLKALITPPRQHSEFEKSKVNWPVDL